MEQLPKQTPGQVAYEAYCEHTEYKSLVSGANLPVWYSLDAKIQEAWEVAASAVIAHHNRD